MLVLYNYAIVVHHISYTCVISSTAMLENILAPYIRVLFLNAAEMKERERLAQKEWIGVAPLRQVQVLKLEVGCSVCQKAELWHWALALASLWWASARVAKNKERKLNEFQTQTYDQPSSEWSTHTTFQNETTDLVTGNNQLRFKNGAPDQRKAAQGLLTCNSMQFERYRNGSPMVSLECVKWLGHVPIHTMLASADLK